VRHQFSITVHINKISVWRYLTNKTLGAVTGPSLHLPVLLASLRALPQWAGDSHPLAKHRTPSPHDDSLRLANSTACQSRQTCSAVWWHNHKTFSSIFFINLHDTVGKWLCFMTGAGVFHQSKQNNNNNG